MDICDQGMVIFDMDISEKRVPSEDGADIGRQACVRPCESEIVRVRVRVCERESETE